MKLYNTPTRSIEIFKPISDGVVKLYTCGPTVYDYPHIGNLRAYVFNDTLRRTLEANDYEVKHVMNITDVGHLVSDEDEGEDKLEKGALREGKTVWQIAEHYTEAFKKDVTEMCILPPNGYTGREDGYARATDFIDEQLEIVKLLVDKGFAYQTEQAIYFETSKLADYGLLTGQKLSDKEVAARTEVITDTNKHHPQDFAIWFFTIGRFAKHEMHWQSPWGDGFPGWHLECSAIIHATLQEPIDIHTGGVDHIGTHHTNEIAQTEAAYGHKLANYWVHNEHLLVDHHKMSKSLGNYYTLKDIKLKGFDPLALRLLFLQAHYRNQMNFTWESMEAAHNLLSNLQKWSDLQFQNLNSHDLKTNYPVVFEKFAGAMGNDLATPEAIGLLSGMISSIDELGADSESIKNYAKKIDTYLGLGLSNRSDISSEQKKTVNDREAARNAKDWNRADTLRQQLVEQGIEINDMPSGPIWSRTA